MTALALVADTDAWRRHAACKNMPLDVFFSGSGSVPVLAKQTCAVCPVRAECLADDLATTDVYFNGYRGGLSAPARQRLRDGS